MTVHAGQAAPLRRGSRRDCTKSALLTNPRHHHLGHEQPLQNRAAQGVERHTGPGQKWRYVKRAKMDTDY